MNPPNTEEFSITDFLQNNIIQILLLGLVFLIIYAVDQVTHLNNLIAATQQQEMMKKHMKQMKKGKKSKK
jgi:cell division protein FtsL